MKKEKNKMKKEKITVRWENEKGDEVLSEEVEAFLVGGDEGVFAVWGEKSTNCGSGTLIKFAQGDDGNWRGINVVYDLPWLDEIIEALKALRRNYS